MKALLTASFCLATILLTGCLESLPNTTIPFADDRASIPADPAAIEAATREGIYVLSNDTSNMFRNNALRLVSIEEEPQIVAETSLLRSWAKNFSRDPQGKIWIGYSGSISHSDNRVQVYSPEGELIDTLEDVCRYPEAGINFAANRAFIACAESGFSGAVVVVGLDKLEIEKVIELFAESSYLIKSSSFNGETLIISGSTRPPEGSVDDDDPLNHDPYYAFITLLDPETLEIQAQVGPLKDVDIWDILPYGDKFYLLNVNSWKIVNDTRNILVLDPQAAFDADGELALEEITVAPSPLWGTIDGDYLYSYHNPTYNQLNSDPARALSRLNLATGEREVWPLPDLWNAGDVEIVDGRIILSRWKHDDPTQHGLFEFDPESGELTKILDVPYAEDILVVE